MYSSCVSLSVTFKIIIEETQEYEIVLYVSFYGRSRVKDHPRMA